MMQSIGFSKYMHLYVHKFKFVDELIPNHQFNHVDMFDQDIFNHSEYLNSCYPLPFTIIIPYQTNV